MSESHFYKDIKEHSRMFRVLACSIPTRASYHVLVSAHGQTVESAFRQQYVMTNGSANPNVHKIVFAERMIFLVALDMSFLSSRLNVNK